MDKNEILREFSGTFFIEREKMNNFFEKNNLENFDEILNEFESMRAKAFDFLWNESESKINLTSKEIEDLSRTYLSNNYPWINDAGIKAVTNHLVWMCWHEGVMKNR